MLRQGPRTLAIITCHYSKSDPHRICAGLSYDTLAFRTYSLGIKQGMETVFGTGHNTAYSIVCGFDIDKDLLAFHGTNGDY